jgi:plastocyanin
MKLRLLSTMFALLALAIALLAIPLTASGQEVPIQIGVDNAGPSGHNFEYVDFFPRAGATIHNGDTVDFAWNKNTIDGFHTASVVPLDSTPQATWQAHPLVKADGDDSNSSLQFNLELLGTQPSGCKGDTAADACTYDGDTLVSSAAQANTGGPHFFVKFELDTSLPKTINFVCLVHPGMQGTLTVAPDGPVSTQTELDAASATQLTLDNNDALAAETAANQKSVATNPDHTHTITMTAGTATKYVEVVEMLPQRVEVRPGDHVKWVTTAQKDPHTVTFPATPGPGIDPMEPIGAPVCEAGPPDSPATGDPPTFGCGESFPEFPLIWQPGGPTSITTTSTAATSGIIATFPGAPFPNNYTFTFPNSGTFAYACRIHDHMVGTIVVNPAQAASNPPVLAQTGRPASAPSWPILGGVIGLLLLGIGLFRARRLIQL